MGVRTVVTSVGMTAILRLGSLMGTVRRRFNMATTTPMTTTNTMTTTRRRRARFGIRLASTKSSGVGMVGIMHRTANLNLGRTGTLISNTPNIVGRTMSGRSTRTLGTRLRRINTSMAIGWSFFGELFCEARFLVIWVS